MSYIIEHEGPLALFKGIGPQITKGLLVQGLLMMTKERYVARALPAGVGVSCNEWEEKLMEAQDGNPLHRPLRSHSQTPVDPAAENRG